MRLTRLCLGLAVLAWCGAAAAEPEGDIEKLEAAASAHVAAYSALDTRRSTLSMQYQSLVEELTQRLKFGTAPKNPVLLKTWQQADAALAALGDTTEPLAALAADLTDDAAQANALGRAIRSQLAAPGADEARLRPLATRIAAADDTLDRSLAQALEQRRKQAEMLKTDHDDLGSLAKAIDTGHLPDGGTADPTIAQMLAPPKLMDQAPAAEAAPHSPAETGRWVIEFGLFPTQDDAAYIMARLSLRGTSSRFVPLKDRHGRAAFKVVTRSFATRAAAEAAAGEMRRHDLHPSGVVAAPAG